MEIMSSERISRLIMADTVGLKGNPGKGQIRLASEVVSRRHGERVMQDAAHCEAADKSMEVQLSPEAAVTPPAMEGKRRKFVPTGQLDVAQPEIKTEKNVSRMDARVVVAVK
ncbi:hypothetical protein ACP4OV_027285 [Aristida adscensionis]